MFQPPDQPIDYRSRRRFGETDFQTVTREDFERLEIQIGGYPDCLERVQALSLLRQACEAAVIAAGKVQR